MRKKQSRPLYVPKPETGDFPFNYESMDMQEVKNIDIFRMYNCMRMVMEKLIPDQALQNRVTANIDQVFKVFLEPNQNPPPAPKLVGRRNSPYTQQKQEFWDFVEQLNGMGFTYKQIAEKLQVHYVQISTHHRNGMKYSEEEEESNSEKKANKERMKKEQVVMKSEHEHEVFYSDDDK